MGHLGTNIYASNIIKYWENSLPTIWYNCWEILVPFYSLWCNPDYPINKLLVYNFGNIIMFSGNIIDEEDIPVVKVVTVQYLHTMIEDEIMGRIARQKLVPVVTVASNEIFISSACHV